MLGAGVAAGEWHPGLSWKPVEWLQKQSFKQCCGSEMIYSGSSYEFLEFRVPIRILPMLFKHIWKSFFKNLNFNQKVLVESTGTVSTICNFLFPTTVLQYSTVLTQSRIQRRPKFKIKFLSAFSFFFVSGSKTIIRDPDPGKVPDPIGSGSTTFDLKELCVCSISAWPAELDMMAMLPPPADSMWGRTILGPWQR